jgi:translation elongation factor EF-Tu-like GTPase
MASEPVIVSATDGPLPPTVEQMKALKAQGATSVDVVISNTNLVDDEELLELVELEIREIAEQNGLAVGSITRSGSGPSDPSGIYGPPS